MTKMQKFWQSVFQFAWFPVTLAYFLSVATLSLCAALIAAESFDYRLDTPLRGANGGTGWDGPWFASPLRKNDNLVVEPSMTHPGLAVAGGRMKQIGQDVRSFRKIDLRRKEIAPLVADGAHGKALGKPGTTVWIGFLIAMPSHPQSAYGGIHLCDGLGDLTKDPFGDKRTHQRISMGRSNTSKGWYLGRVTNGAPGAGKWDSEVAVDDKTRLLVYRFDFHAKAVEAWLFIDPALDEEPAAKFASLHAKDMTPFLFNTLSVGSGGNAIFHLDEIRIGSTFGDVTPRSKS
jgi:hypothetical protein